MQFLRDYICCGGKKEIENNTLSLTEQEFRDWSNLPHDIVQLISSMLPPLIVDNVSMKQVCSSWRMAMRNGERTPYSVVVPIASPETKGEYVCIIKQKNEKGPLVDDDGLQYSKKLLGYRPDGWVIFTDQLLHLFLNVRKQIPSVTNYAGGYGVVLENCMSKAGIFTYSEDPNDFVAVMSFHDCYHRGYKKYFIDHETKHDVKHAMSLGYWKPNRVRSPVWVTFGELSFIHDIAACNEHKIFYTIRGGYREKFADKSVVGWDFKDKYPEKKFIIQLSDNYCDNYMLVQSVVITVGEESYVVNYDYLSRCVIYKLDSCKKVNLLNGHVLLLSNFCDSIILSCVDDKLNLPKLVYTLWKEKVHQASIVVEKKIQNPSQLA